MSAPQTIWVTRPQPDATDTAARLEALGFETLVCPLLDLKVQPAALPDPQTLSGLVVTSANALRALDLLGAIAPYRTLPVFAVGDKTATAAQDLGFAVVQSASGDVAALTTLLTATAPGGALFYPTTARATGDLPGALAPKGITVHRADIYEMAAITLPEHIPARLVDGTITAISFYSRHTAAIFCQQVCDHLEPAARQQLLMLCLSENVAAPLLEHHFTRIGLADYPSEEAMMALALSALRDQIGGE